MVVLELYRFDKQLFKMKRDRTVYSDVYQKRIAKLVEYYLDKITKLVYNFNLKNLKQKLGYSVEETDWEAYVYTKLLLFTMGNTNMKTFQCLFLQRKNQELYEFDVPKIHLSCLITDNFQNI